MKKTCTILIALLAIILCSCDKSDVTTAGHEIAMEEVDGTVY